MNKNIISKLYKLAEKAYRKGEVPVGCIITKNDKIIAATYNLKETKNNPLYHAEIIAITKACKKIKNWRLDQCKMYVTLEPCDMCKKIINEARISEVIYILNSKGNKKLMTKYIKCDIKNEIFKKILVSFFKEKR